MMYEEKCEDWWNKEQQAIKDKEEAERKQRNDDIAQRNQQFEAVKEVIKMNEEQRLKRSFVSGDFKKPLQTVV